ncbi:Putative clathrin assembly protein At4g40080 [Linum grandiflorum]
MVRHRSRLRLLVGILKDNSSLLKALLLSTKRTATTKLRLAILRATSHSPSAPPSNRSLSAVLSLGGDGSRRTAAACITSLLDRLHGSNNAHVALKCLLTLHAVVSQGSFILKDQFSAAAAGGGSGGGGRNFLNLSKFRDESDPETWELSSWVRWYAAVIEQNLAGTKKLGSSGSNFEKLSRDLIEEIEILVDSVGLICESPAELKSNDLVYEVVKSVGEDYRLVQREISVRVLEMRDRMKSLSFDELTRLSSEMERLEDSRDGVASLFVNGKRNDALWETVAETKEMARATMMEKDEMKKLVTLPPAGAKNRFPGPVGWVGRLVMS